MAGNGKTRISTHIEVEWLSGEAAEAVCPNCGAAGLVERYLDIDYRPPDAEHRFVLQICPVCSARFVDNAEMMDYATEELIEIGWNIYQVQLGAGVWPISAPLTRIEKPTGARVLEIGGAFGFGLDFCIRARGWVGEGYDPSPLAGFGARELGLDIRRAYFGEDDLSQGPWDVVIATEVIEHIGHPPAFLNLMRRALAPDGLLVMTTPDAEWIAPALPAGLLMPLLSPGAHQVLQTAQSLQTALLAAGFAHVQVKREAMSLVAYASTAPFTLSGDDEAARAMYRRYLVERGTLTSVESDLRFGFAGRGLFEAANDGDDEAAQTAWEAMLPAAQTRFGIDLEAITTLPPGAGDASLAELARLMPLGLGMILFGRAMQLLAAKAERVALLPMLRVAGEAIDALQGALGKRSLTDALCANIRQIIDVEILLCRAEAGEAACVPDIVARHDEVLGWRGFVALVNAGAIGAAGTLKSTLLADVPPATLPGNLRRNALLSLANFALAPGGDSVRAIDYALALRSAGENADKILLGAFTRLVNASRYDEALAANAAHGIDALALADAGEAGRDARLARMMLDLAVGDPAEIPQRIAGLDLPQSRREALLLEAFIRLANSSRFAEAVAFSTAHDVPGLVARHDGPARSNAAIALAVLDLAAGDPACVASRFAGVAVDPARRDALLMGAFTGLINTSRYDEAEALAAGAAWFAALEHLGGAAATDARLAAAMLDLQRGRTEAAMTRLESLTPADADPAVLARLMVDTFIRLVNEQKFAAAQAVLQRHALERRLTACNTALRHDALAALLALELQPGGNPARIVQRVEEVMNGGLEETRYLALGLSAFVTLVNGGEFSTARLLLHLVEPMLIKARPPFDDAMCNGLFAAGILFLQDRGELRRAVTILARLRDGLVKRNPPGAPPDPLFWPALRGEVLALHKLNRGADATALLQTFGQAYADMPDDLRQHIESLPI
jgi:SAM-dependent methyltransferase